MNREIEILKQQVAELMEWKRQKTLQQIKNPLDPSSEKVIQKHLPVFQRWVGSTITNTGRIYVVIDGTEYQINCKPTNTSIT